MIRIAKNVKLNIRPIYIDVEHLYYYEGPCRFAAGDALRPGADAFMHAERCTGFLDNLKNAFPDDKFNILECAHIRRTDNWDYSEKDWETMDAAQEGADIFVIMAALAGDDIALEFYERYRKPIALVPESLFSLTSIKAAILSRFPDAEVYSPEDWDDLVYQMTIMRGRKVIRSTNVLCAVRFNSTTSLSSVDTFIDHEAITRKLGCHFRYCNIHELIDNMELPKPEGNYTTPGRVTPNVNEEDIKELEKIADELIGGAKTVAVEREYVMRSLKAWRAVQKVMEVKDCNAFTAPCPDCCSTRRLNESKFTFCLCHSLNSEAFIPSACEYDVDSCLSEQALIAVSGQCPYLGNTTPMIWKNGSFGFNPFVTEEELEPLKKNPENLYYMEHSVANRRMVDPNRIGEYALRHFALDQGFGAVIRYDFAQDIGTPITLCRFSPDCSKMLVGKGIVAGSGGYERDNCQTTIVFRVKDRKDFWEKQNIVGNHICMVYGDYTRELADLAKSLGVEVLYA